MEEERIRIHDQLCCLQNEQESILSMIGNEIDAACEVFSRDSLEKFNVIMTSPSASNFILVNLLMGMCYGILSMASG